MLVKRSLVNHKWLLYGQYFSTHTQKERERTKTSLVNSLMKCKVSSIIEDSFVSSFLIGKGSAAGVAQQKSASRTEHEDGERQRMGPARQWWMSVVQREVLLCWNVCFLNFNIHNYDLRVLSSFRLCFRRTGMRPEIPNYCQALGSAGGQTPFGIARLSLVSRLVSGEGLSCTV